jgi:hypothetical protein
MAVMLDQIKRQQNANAEHLDQRLEQRELARGATDTRRHRIGADTRADAGAIDRQYRLIEADEMRRDHGDGEHRHRRRGLRHESQRRAADHGRGRPLRHLGEEIAHPDDVAKGFSTGTDHLDAQHQQAKREYRRDQRPPARRAIEIEVEAEAGHADERIDKEADVDRRKQHQRRRADIRPGEDRPGARNGDEVRRGEAHQDHGDGVGALRQRAGNRADRGAEKVVVRGTRDPVPETATGELTHIRAEAFDANEEQAQPGKDGYSRVDKHEPPPHQAGIKRPLRP